MASTPKKKTLLWISLYILTGIIDIAQFISTLTGFGIVLNEAVEPFVGVGLLIILQSFGVSVINNPKRLASLLASFGLDAISAGAAPFWIMDVFYIHYSYRHEQAQLEQIVLDGPENPLNKRGIRLPTIDQKEDNFGRNANNRPLVIDGVRAPQK